MEKQLQIFKDGSLYELEGEEAVKETQTQGQVKLLIEALQFTQAETFIIAADDTVPPQVVEPRAPQKQINQEGLKLIKTFEGLHELRQGPQGTYVEAYLDPVNVPTIGWGCTEGVKMGMKITVAQAEAMLRTELGKFEAAVANCVKVNINDDQYAALVCFSYNVGARALFESTLLKFLNQGKIPEAANEFLRWDKAGGQALLGLSRRRRAEQALFLSKSWQSALQWNPSRVLQLAKPGQSIMQGDDVRQLQEALIKKGFDIEADGFFGAGTDKAVKEFQQKQGLSADGIVGSQTLAKLGL